MPSNDLLSATASIKETFLEVRLSDILDKARVPIGCALNEYEAHELARQAYQAGLEDGKARLCELLAPDAPQP